MNDSSSCPWVRHMLRHWCRRVLTDFLFCVITSPMSCLQLKRTGLGFRGGWVNPSRVDISSEGAWTSTYWQFSCTGSGLRSLPVQSVRAYLTCVPHYASHITSKPTQFHRLYWQWAEKLASTVRTCLSYVRPTLFLAYHIETNPISPRHERGREGESTDGGIHAL